MLTMKLNRIFRLSVLSALFIVAVALAGCSSSGTDPEPPYDVDANLAAAWQKFTSANYDGAIAGFSDVIAHAGSNSEAYLGRAWSKAYDKDFSGAVSDFNTAKTNGLDTPADADMGLAAVYRDYPAGNPDYQSAISHASAVIGADSSYVFWKRVTINFKDAHLIKAQSYFRLGESYFSLAHGEVNLLCEYQAIGLLASPESFTEGGYEEALAAKLDVLTELID